MKISKKNFDFTSEQIAEAIDTWANFPGFYGETCGRCKKTANVLGGLGWVCTCGHYNSQHFLGGPMPHENPDLGPSLKIIKSGADKSEKLQEYANKTNLTTT